MDRQDWVSVGELLPGETVKTVKGTTTVESYTMCDKPEPVFNLEVEGDHVYRVGEQGILVHNASVFLAGDDKYAEGYEAIFGDDCKCLPKIAFSLTGKAALVAAHIQAALNAGKPKKLTLDKDKGRKNTRRAQVCPRNTCPKQGDPATHSSCDEYPFASTTQGGTGSSIRCVPPDDQNSQGGTLGRFYDTLKDGAEFCVVVIP